MATINLRVESIFLLCLSFPLDTFYVEVEILANSRLQHPMRLLAGAHRSQTPNREFRSIFE